MRSVFHSNKLKIDQAIPEYIDIDLPDVTKQLELRTYRYRAGLSSGILVSYFCILYS